MCSAVQAAIEGRCGRRGGLWAIRDRSVLLGARRGRGGFASAFGPTEYRGLGMGSIVAGAFFFLCLGGPLSLMGPGCWPRGLRALVPKCLSFSVSSRIADVAFQPQFPEHKETCDQLDGLW